MKSFHVLLTTLAAILMMSLAPSPALAGPGETTPAVKAEFKKLCSKRAQLVRTLAKLDNKAADMLASGDDPIEINAEQTAAQDEMDLLQLRLESMSIRHDLPLPGMPKAGDGIDDEKRMETKARSMFLSGQERTNRIVLKRTRQLLSRIDFTSFNRN